MKNLLNIALIAVVLIVLGCKCQQTLDELKNASQSPSPTASTSPSASPSGTKSDSSKSDNNKNESKTDSSDSGSSTNLGVTKAAFNKIEVGMKRSEVVKIIGSEGEEMTRSKGGSSTFTSHKWEGDGYAIITAVFKDDVLTNKYEANLK